MSCKNRFFLAVLFAACLFSIREGFSSSEENIDQRNRLEVRKSFPRYRVYYDHQKTIQEVQKEIEEEKTKPAPEKKSKGFNLF